MKVGDYVRTSSGKIAKYLGHEGDIYKFDDDIYWFYEYYNDYVYDEDYEEWLEEKEVKVYKDIISLIQVGDYVNGEKVVDKFNYLLAFGDGQDGNWYIRDDEIESIVSKEQFSQMEYKVKE